MEDSWKPNVLVIGPAGIRGLLELGSLLAAEKAGMLREIDTIVGCSVGSLIGLLITAGLSISEIIETALRVDFFEDVESVLHVLRTGRPSDVLSQLPTVRDRKGLLSNKVVRDEIERQLRSKFGTSTPTLGQLYMATGIKFVVVTMNLDQRKTVYLSHETDPDLSVLDAVSLSMNIPLIFYQLRYRGELYVDGAVGDPYPVGLFSDTENRVLGISVFMGTRLSTTPSSGRSSDDTIVSYLLQIVYATLDAHRDRILQQSRFPCGARHLLLVDNKAPNLDLVGISFTTEQKNEMVAEGYRQGKEFFSSGTGPLVSHERLPLEREASQEFQVIRGTSGSHRSITLDSDDPIPLLSAFLSSNPQLTGALQAMTSGRPLER